MEDEAGDSNKLYSRQSSLLVAEYEGLRDEVNRRIQLQNAGVRYLLLAGGAIFGVLATMVIESKEGMKVLWDVSSGLHPVALFVLWGFAFLSELIIANSTYQLGMLFSIANYQREKIKEVYEGLSESVVRPTWDSKPPKEYLSGVPKILREGLSILQTLILHIGALVGMFLYVYVWWRAGRPAGVRLAGLIALVVGWSGLAGLHLLLVRKFNAAKGGGEQQVTGTDQTDEEEAGGGSPEEEKYLDSYRYFARVFRLWLIAYGMGVPAIILAEPGLRENLLDHGNPELVILLFLLGAALQALSALLYKYAMWHLYVGECKGGEAHRSTWLYRASDWISESHWLEFVLDALSVGFLVAGTALAFCVLSG